MSFMSPSSPLYMYCTMAVAFFSVAKICHFVVVLFRLFLVVKCERYHKKKTLHKVDGWLQI